MAIIGIIGFSYLVIIYLFPLDWLNNGIPFISNLFDISAESPTFSQ